MSDHLENSLVWRGERAYEEIRQTMLWNAWTPDRFPEVIATVGSEQGVVEAVGLARSRGMKVAVRGSGHSFCGSPLRDDGMLIDLSRLRDLSIDPESRTAMVQPALTGRELADALAEHDLGFPVGHCGSVALSGYLLCGGFGWNMGVWGPACFSLRRLNVATPDAELVTADENQNADLLWAARGAGPGFFGVATRFEVGVYALPRTVMSSTYMYPLAEVGELSRWATGLVPTLPRTLEMLLLLASAPPGKVVGVTAAAFADSDEEAVELLSALETYPGLDRAVLRQSNERTSIQGLQEQLGAFLPEGPRYAADAVWSNQGPDQLLPGVAEHFARAPSPRSVVLAPMVPPPPEGAPLPDAAFSMADRSLLLPYAIWDDGSEDDLNTAWLRQLTRSLEPHTTGHYVGEADLPADSSRAVRSFAAPNWDKLEALRAEHDPDGLFHSYLGPKRVAA